MHALWWQRGNVCIADSLCCRVETNATCKVTKHQIKEKKERKSSLIVSHLVYQLSHGFSDPLSNF